MQNNIDVRRENGVKIKIFLFTSSSHARLYARGMKTSNPITVMSAAALWLLLSGCAPKSAVVGAAGYPSAYLVAAEQNTNPPKPLDVTTLSAQQAHALATFQHVFAHLPEADLAARIGDSYASNFYFNDTFKTLHQRGDLIAYLEATAAKAKVRMTPLAVIGNGPDFYLKWYMEMEYQVMGETITSDSIGITQLRFNNHGKIVLQQDFWDGVEGFYQDLPFIGYWLKKIRGGM